MGRKLVYRYGAVMPSQDGEIRHQMALTRQYYNRLVYGENLRRKALWGADRPVWPHPPEIVIDEDTGKKCTKLCRCDECKQFADKLAVDFKALGFMDIKPFRNSEPRPYWGSYLLAERAFSAAVKKTNRFSTVKYRSKFDGGYVGVQIQRSVNPENVFKVNRIDDPRTGRKRRGHRHEIRIRVGSDGIKPIWSDPIVFEMHRPIVGRVVWVEICMRYRMLTRKKGEDGSWEGSGREVWSICVTCDDVPQRTDLAQHGVAAIDIGWRTLEDGRGLRLAYAQGMEGEIHELVMSPEWVERINRADRIRGHRADKLDVLKIMKPELGRIRSPGKVRAYVEEHELSDPIVEQWLKDDRHLKQYEDGCRRGSVNARRDAVRKWVRMLRRKYAVAIVKNTNHKELKNHDTAVENGMFPSARKNAHRGAPGEIVEWIHIVFGRNGGTAIVDATATTSSCPKCGNKNIIGSEQFIACERCGDTKDRDNRSTTNMIKLYWNGEYKLPTARKSTPKFAKRHKKFVEEQQCQPNGF